MKDAKEFIEFDLGAITLAPALPPASRTARYVGTVTRERSERVLKELEKLAKKGSGEIGLFVSSPGGATGAAMSFFDTITQIMKPELVTIGSGNVDSSGVIVFLAGARRYLSARTTLLLHPAGRFFGRERYTTKEMAAMLAEDRAKDEHYAALLSARSRGALSAPEALALMEAHTVLSPARAVSLGLADAVLP